MRLWRAIKNARDYSEGETYFEELIKLVESEKKDLAKEYRKLQKQDLAFLNYPPEVRKHLYTTNAVESINSGIEKMRMDLGGYFPPPSDPLRSIYLSSLSTFRTCGGENPFRLFAVVLMKLDKFLLYVMN